MNSQGKKIFRNGILLIGVTLFLAAYFTLGAYWNVATVVITVLLILLSVLQFIMYFKFFKNK